MIDLDVVIVNWNSGHHLRACIHSLAAEPALRLQVLVVDNASRDDSLDIPPQPGLALRIVRNAENAGFARACNQGAALGQARHILFLNPDCRVPAGTLPRVRAFLSSAEGEHTGICGVRLLDDDGHTARSCSRTPRAGHVLGRAFALDRLAPSLVPPHFRLDWDHGDSRSVEQVMGAFFWVRRPLFERLGGFDERFFVYYEEVDLAVRAAAAGWDIHFLADVAVNHTGAGTTDAVRALRQFYLTRSRLLYAWKHFGAPGAIAASAATLLVEPAARVLGFLARGDVRSARESAAAAAMLWHDLPGTRAVHRRARAAGSTCAA